MNPLVTGFLCDPSSATTLPCCTVTASVHASGQSSGHAVSTIVAGPRRTGSEAIGSRILRIRVQGSGFRVHGSRFMVPHVVIIGGGFGGLFAARAFDGAGVRV